MPGYTIHIAIAKEYIKKHPKEIKNEKEFLKGTIYPDLNPNKNMSHYGNWDNYDAEIVLEEFLKDKKVNIYSDFWKGYFLHLYSDKKFLNEYFYEEFLELKNNNEKFYDDYDKLELRIRNFYNIKEEDYPDGINVKFKLENGETKYLKYSKIKKMINEISNIDINKEIKMIKKEG